MGKNANDITLRFRVLKELVREYNVGIGAEIGVSSGNLSRRLLGNFSELHWIAVDFWPPEYPTFAGPPRGVHAQRKHERNFQRVQRHFRSRLKLYRMPSLEAAPLIEDGSLDLVFIDADHSYEGCRDDIAAWAPKVKRGGLVTGHDYCDDYPGVIKAVDEVYGPQERNDGQVWWAVKE